MSECMFTRSIHLHSCCDVCRQYVISDFTQAYKVKVSYHDEVDNQVLQLLRCDWWVNFIVIRDFYFICLCKIRNYILSRNNINKIYPKIPIFFNYINSLGS